ncbi:Diadenosine tetraphosphate (Ap4A) hydrolase [Seinonella peptonophila]|uniref:Diadenosine tetraphosphate (Ap4A) hydrolase n=1 Tax=Seinonella peptonophila TaxID=112248 RepID=A0A1M4Z6X6_9BACL|nr:HIT family protein [Seinonella peptonophila]SHF13522.1 Diadenosine tetraphosphate (Ap4A) hydrolase [Seinonella peptonophila]
MEDCIFCKHTDKILENNHAFAIFDQYPVSKGHILIIAKRHVADYFSLTIREKFAIEQLLDAAKEKLIDEYQPDGFNIGINCGQAAGQSVPHTHVHLIPRYVGDLENPLGGVRGVIPDKRLYP